MFDGRGTIGFDEIMSRHCFVVDISVLRPSRKRLTAAVPFFDQTMELQHLAVTEQDHDSSTITFLEDKVSQVEQASPYLYPEPLPPPVWYLQNTTTQQAHSIIEQKQTCISTHQH